MVLPPVTRNAYDKSLLHLHVINFPCALAAFLFTVVFNVTGTTLLMALPLGALLSFFNLIGVRALDRGELALQTKYVCLVLRACIVAVKMTLD
ncbi:hypothetical protein C8J57DRAFT_1528617 [Mycena rebaudengoi]|nr:hypothetical protein C8J57DRAFT_1528617 [Mycena rebaudengoi]